MTRYVCRKQKQRGTLARDHLFHRYMSILFWIDVETLYALHGWHPRVSPRVSQTPLAATSPPAFSRASRIVSSCRAMGLRFRSHGPNLYSANLLSAHVQHISQGAGKTHGIGMKSIVRHPNNVFPQSTPRFLNNGLATIGMPAPIMLRTKSLLASTEAAYAG